MTSYFKILCGAIALGLSIFSWIRNNQIIGCYWMAVTLYWFFNYIGG